MSKLEFTLRVIAGVIVCLVATMGMIDPETPSSITAYIFLNILAMSLYLNYLSLVIQIRAINDTFTWLLRALESVAKNRALLKDNK